MLSSIGESASALSSRPRVSSWRWAAKSSEALLGLGFGFGLGSEQPRKKHGPSTW